MASIKSESIKLVNVFFIACNKQLVLRHGNQAFRLSLKTVKGIKVDPELFIEEMLKGSTEPFMQELSVNTLTFRTERNSGDVYVIAALPNNSRALKKLGQPWLAPRDYDNRNAWAFKDAYTLAKNFSK